MSDGIGAEVWLPIPGHDGYEASSEGRVRSIARVIETRNGQSRRLPGCVIRGTCASGGYRMVALGAGVKRYVHHLVAEAFIGPRPDGYEICHNDGDRFNNHPENLRYDTPTENKRDTVRHGTHGSLAKTHCPRGHRLEHPNLVPRRERKCKCCDYARWAVAQGRIEEGRFMEAAQYALEHYRLGRPIPKQPGALRAALAA